MPTVTPVDQLSFAELVARYSEYLTEQKAASTRFVVKEYNGPGPVYLTEADDAGKRLRIGNGAAEAVIIVYLPANSSAGAVYLPRQVGAGKLKFVVQGAATLVPAQATHNGTAGLNTSVTIGCEKNVDGNSALYHLDGYTGPIA